MSGLRDSAEAIARRPPPQRLASERLNATERAAAALESRRIGAEREDEEDAESLQQRLDVIDAHSLRRLIGTIWPDPAWNRAAFRLIGRAREIGTRSLDRAIILAYLRHYPAEHIAFDDLRAVAAASSVAHDWPWAARGERWALWSADGPARVRAAIAEQRIEDRGLLRILADSAFLAASDPAPR